MSLLPAVGLQAFDPGCGCHCGENPCTICMSRFNGDPYAECLYTIVSGYWLEENGALYGFGEGCLLLFEAAPALPTDGVKVTIIPLPDDPYGPATFWLLAGWIDEVTFVFGELKLEDGIATIRCGQNGGYLTEPLEVGTGGLHIGKPLSLCWRPPVQQEVTDGVVGEILPDDASGWSDSELALNVGGGHAHHGGSITGGESTPAISFTWDPPIPDGATITGIAIAVVIREAAVPADNIQDQDATLLTNGVERENKAQNVQIPSGNEFGLLSYGGQGDLWGAPSLTADDVANVGFTLTLGKPAGQPDGTEAYIDYAALVIWFQTRADVPGRLTVVYDSTCATAFDVDGESGKSGLKIQEGDWTFDSYKLEYHSSGPHPGCASCTCSNVAPHPYPPACGCCAEGFPPAASMLLLLPGGWTNDTCTACNGVNGAYILDASGLSACGWQYQEPLTCGVSPCSELGTNTLVIDATLTETVGVCKWRVQVVILPDLVVQDPSDPDETCVAYAIYESAPLASAEDCQNFPVILTKVEENTGSMCDGALPTTLMLDQL